MWLYLLFLLPVAVVIWLLYEWYEHEAVQYTTTEVECQKLPENTELRVCLVSDLHNNRKNLAELMARIRGFSPELILLAGDLVDKHKEENEQAEAFVTALSELSVPVYYSAGNHETSLMENYPEAFERYMEYVRGKACYLDNSGVTYQEESKETPAIYISGLSLPMEYYKKGSLQKNEELLPELHVPEDCIHIMLAHNPEYADSYGKYHADLIVSGHLHGGLMRLPFLGGLVSPRLRLPKGCDAGLVTMVSGGQLFVSRGLGSHTIPLRFFNRVEINFLVLKGTGN